MPASGYRHLFVTGCGRSGTSAMVYLLNADPRLAIGVERYKYLKGRFGPEHLEPERLLRPVPEETNHAGPEFYGAMAEKFERGTVLYTGDKVVSSLDGLLQRVATSFPRARLLFMLRDPEQVAASYQGRADDPDDPKWPATRGHEAAIGDWNRGLANLRKAASGNPDLSFLILPFDEFYGGDRGWLERIYDLVELEPSAEVLDGYGRTMAKWRRRRGRHPELDPAARAHVAERRHGPYEAWARRVIEREREGRIPRGMGFPRGQRDRAANSLSPVSSGFSSDARE